MDSNWIHVSSGQNSGAAPKMVLAIDTVLMIADDSGLIEYETSDIGKVITISFCAYVERLKWRSFSI
jgi:hypothetical protein